MKRRRWETHKADFDSWAAMFSINIHSSAANEILAHWNSHLQSKIGDLAELESRRNDIRKLFKKPKGVQ